MTDDGPDPFASAGDRPDDLESTVRLIDRARTGDPDALERLMQRHLGPLRRWARGRLPRWARDAADTDDLVQDTLLRTFKSLDDFEVRGAGALQAYLRTAIQNRVRDELRQKPPARGRRSRRPRARPRSVPARGVDRTRKPRALRTRAGDTRTGRAGSHHRPDRNGVFVHGVADALQKPNADAARKAVQRAVVSLARHMNGPVG